MTAATPSAPTRQVEQTPAIAELTQLDQWVISKYVRRRDKLDKPPFSPNLDAEHKDPWMCSHSDPTHWGSYDTARKALRGFLWMGFVFHESDPYSGIDLDGCCKPECERIRTRDDIEAWALRIIDLVSSYTEISPSGKGVKIFARGTLAETLLHSLGEHKGLEIYSKQRYFTVTGAHLASTPTEIRDAQAALDQLDREYRPAAPPARPAAAQHISQAQPRQQGGRASLDDVRAQFNAEHAPDQLLLDYGATQTSSKDFSCPFCEHSHTNTLFIYNGRIYSRSPGCKIPQKKGLDPFALYVLIEHNNDVIAAAKKLNPIESRKRQAEQPPATQPEQRQQTPAQAADAQRKREATATRTAEIRASVEQRASQDDRLSDSGQLVLMALLDIAGKRSWCRPSVARIAEMITMSERSVFYGLKDLAKHGYIANSSAPGRTTVRTFLPLQAEQPNLGALHPDVIASEDLDLTLVACEGGAASPATVEPAQIVEPPYDWQTEYDQVEALEQHLLVYPGGASYSPPAVEPTGAYTGRVKDFQSFAEQWAVATSAIKVRPDVEPAPAEQQLLDDAPPSSAKPPRKSGRRAEISALDRYRADVALMSEIQLAGELKKHQRTLKKHAGAVWLDGVRERLAIVQAEIDQLDEQALLGRPGAGRARPSRAQRPQAAPNPFAGQQSLFDVPRGVAAD